MSTNRLCQASNLCESLAYGIPSERLGLIKGTYLRNRWETYIVCCYDDDLEVSTLLLQARETGDLISSSIGARRQDRRSGADGTAPTDNAPHLYHM